MTKNASLSPLVLAVLAVVFAPGVLPSTGAVTAAVALTAYGDLPPVLGALLVFVATAFLAHALTLAVLHRRS